MQHPVGGAGRRRGPVQGGGDPAVVGFQVGAELGAERGEGDAAAGAQEERGADAPFEALHQLADAGPGEQHALGGAAEVQFLGQDQEAVQLIAIGKHG